MLLDDLLENRTLRRALAAGEEQVSRLMGRLASSDTVTGGLQGLLQSAARARETFDRGVQQALRAARLPSREDVDALKRRIQELEAMIDGLSERVGTAERKPGDPEE